jgi:hypothetical protein
VINGSYSCDMPLEVQQQAFEMGIIPYVPGEKEE